MKPGQPLRRTPMPPRTVPMNRGGKPLGRTAAPARRKVTRITTSQPRTVRRETGFPPAVRKAVRERAGNCCEACGIYLGEHGGQIQHRLARKSGGRHGAMRAVVSSVMNAVLLCGTPFTGCHGECEGRGRPGDRDMLAEGFRLEEGQDPAAEPVMLHSESGSGCTKWLTPDGLYSDTPPEGVAA